MSQTSPAMSRTPRTMSPDSSPILGWRFVRNKSADAETQAPFASSMDSKELILHGPSLSRTERQRLAARSNRTSAGAEYFHDRKTLQCTAAQILCWLDCLPNQSGLDPKIDHGRMQLPDYGALQVPCIIGTNGFAERTVYFQPRNPDHHAWVSTDIPSPDHNDLEDEEIREILRLDGVINKAMDLAVPLYQRSRRCFVCKVTYQCAALIICPGCHWAVCKSCSDEFIAIMRAKVTYRRHICSHRIKVAEVIAPGTPSFLLEFRKRKIMEFEDPDRTFCHVCYHYLEDHSRRFANCRLCNVETCRRCKEGIKDHTRSHQGTMLQCPETDRVEREKQIAKEHHWGACDKCKYRIRKSASVWREKLWSECEIWSVLSVICPFPS